MMYPFFKKSHFCPSVRASVRPSVPPPQTGTIRPCICCIWDSIPCRLLRILFWCAAEEMPMRAMSLEQGGEAGGGWGEERRGALGGDEFYSFPL